MARVEEETAEMCAELACPPKAGRFALTRGVHQPHLAAMMDVVLPLLPRFQRSAAAALQPTTDMYVLPYLLLHTLLYPYVRPIFVVLYYDFEY